MMKLVGIVNITEDSFSDGGLYLETEKAVERCGTLVGDGAAILDLGAASSHPDSRPVSPHEEIRRLAPVIHHVRGFGAKISIDSYHPEVQRFAIGEGVDYLNDIQAFSEPAMYDALASTECGLILMHSVQRSGRATRIESEPVRLFDEILEFFHERTRALMRAGIDRNRMILDPGMGFFLGSNPEASFSVLKRIPDLKKEFHLPILISVSRKSFLGVATGREISRRGAATLAAELHAVLSGADMIRTHDVAALADALKIWGEIQNAI